MDIKKDSYCLRCNSLVQEYWYFCPYCRKAIHSSNIVNYYLLVSKFKSSTLSFYEKIIIKSKLHYFYWSILILGIFLAAHFNLSYSYDISMISDYSWFLCLMTSYIFLLVIFATRRLRYYFIDLYRVFNIDYTSPTYFELLRKALGKKYLLLSGSFFGLLNAVFGHTFGIWYKELLPQIIFILHYFLVGFICGVAIVGIIAVIISINSLVKEKNIILNLFSNDRCFGTSVIGNELLLYSLISLSAGLFISFYIYQSPWNNKNSGIIQFITYFWIAFPHLAAVTVLFFPVYKLHTVIRDYKYKIRFLLISQENYFINLLLKQINKNNEKISIDFYKTNLQLKQMTQLKESRLRQW